MPHTLLDLQSLPNASLETVFQDGTTPATSAIAGWEFRGVNTPAWAKLARIKKFGKGFYHRDGKLFGYNVATEQNGVDEPWISKPNDETPKRFGFYRVLPVDPSSRDNAYLHALLLDYSQGGNRRFDPINGLRDYLVQVEEDIFLGKAYYAVRRRRIFASFFVLERWRKGLPDFATA